MPINFDRSKKMHEMKSPFNYTEKVENSASLSSPSFLFTLLSSSCHRALGDARRRRPFALFFLPLPVLSQLGCGVAWRMRRHTSRADNVRGNKERILVNTDPCKRDGWEMVAVHARNRRTWRQPRGREEKKRKKEKKKKKKLDEWRSDSLPRSDLLIASPTLARAPTKKDCRSLLCFQLGLYAKT